MAQPKYTLHPATIKAIQSGHFWVTEDQFSKKIPKHTTLFQGLGPNGKPVGIFHYDKEHPRVLARLLTDKLHSSVEDFIKQKLIKAFEKRKQMKLERNHYYVCFAEADELPGLQILKLADNFIIQYFAFFWEKYQEVIQQTIHENFETGSVWVHKRSLSYSKQTPPQLIYGKFDNDLIEEYGYKMNITLGEYYDYGVYTDMAAIRAKLPSHIFQGWVANLFSYTGAYSLYAAKKGASNVVSVDTSKAFLTMLEKNIELNDFKANFESRCQGAEKFLLDDETFNLIICDPPSAYTYKKKRVRAQDFYKKYILNLADKVEKKGYLLLFLNTHQVKPAKFNQLVLEKLKGFKLINQYSLADDCPTSKGFTEGNYLKGLLLQKV
jgi:23S rRNA (cytosine1962-C5)-methyltransferase